MQGPHEERIGYLTFLMLPLREGSFHMGSEKNDKEAFTWAKPAHEVTVRGFYLGQYPVTQDLWRAVVQAKIPDGDPDPAILEKWASLSPAPSFFEGDRRPVEQVSWDDAQVFIQKLNALTPKNRPAGHIYRLPTEAEWEYAARGLTPGPSPVWRGAGGEAYAGSDKLHEVGWYDGNSHGETKPVGLKLPNALGLYDMSGNVWEWCEDDWHDNYEGAPKDGSAWIDRPERGSYRVLRGGGWGLTARGCRSAFRLDWLPVDRVRNLGFRLALAPQSVG